MVERTGRFKHRIYFLDLVLPYSLPLIISVIVIFVAAVVWDNDATLYYSLDSHPPKYQSVIRTGESRKNMNSQNIERS